VARRRGTRERGMWPLCYQGGYVRRISLPLLARLTSPFRNPGRAIPDWPKLLHLYSRMRTGTTVFEWMQDHDVRSIGIDVRRFASFGVIKARRAYLTLHVHHISRPSGRDSFGAYTAGRSSKRTTHSPRQRPRHYLPRRLVPASAPAA
jgi:hypothetical protein